MAEFIIENIGDNPSDYLDLFGKIRGQIVRCKDCEYFNGEDNYCVNDIFAKPNGYCSYGKRREDETDI